VTPRLLHYSDVENAYDDPERVGRLAGTLIVAMGGPILVVLVSNPDNPKVVWKARIGDPHRPLR